MGKTYPIPIFDNTPEEEEALRRQRLEDPDALEFSGTNVIDRPPPHMRGRTKAQVTVSLDLDLIEALKTPDSKGWQTRLNAAARAGLGLTQNKPTPNSR